MSLREAVARVWANPYARVLLALAAFYLLGRAFAMVQPAGTLFVVAFGLAYLFNPVVDWLEGHRIHRAIGVALVAVALIAIAWLVFALGLTAIRNTLTEGEEGVTLTEAAATFLQDLPVNAQRLLPKDVYDLVALRDRFVRVDHRRRRGAVPARLEAVVVRESRCVVSEAGFDGGWVAVDHGGSLRCGRATPRVRGRPAA